MQSCGEREGSGQGERDDRAGTATSGQAAATPIGEAAALVEDADGGRVIIRGEVAFAFDTHDQAGRRLAAVQLVWIKAATLTDVAAGFEVNQARTPPRPLRPSRLRRTSTSSSTRAASCASTPVASGLKVTTVMTVDGSFCPDMTCPPITLAGLAASIPLSLV